MDASGIAMFLQDQHAAAALRQNGGGRSEPLTGSARRAKIALGLQAMQCLTLHLVEK